MARHRNVRGLKFDEDFEDDDVYGQSVEDDYCISPATAAQFIYKRDDYNSRAFAEEPLEEGDEFVEEKIEEFSHNIQSGSGIDQVRLYACLDKMREVLGESISEKVMVDAVLNCQYDAHKALDLVLSEECKPTPETKNQITAPSRKSTIGDLFHSSKLVASKHTDSCLPVTLLDDTDNSSTFDLSILLSTKSEPSYVSAPMVACESINNESANEGEETQTQSISLLEMIKEPPSVFQTHTRAPNNPFADHTTVNSQKDINLSDLIKDCEGNNQQDLNRTILPVMPNVMDFVRPATDISKLSFLTQNKTEGIFHLSHTELPFKIVDANHSQSSYLTLSSKNPDYLVSSLEDLSLVEQLNQHQKKSNGLNDILDTVDQNSVKDLVEEHRSLSFHQYGSPSLADLIEEHKKSSPNTSDSPSIPHCSSTDSVIVPLGSLSLAQLAGESQDKTPWPLPSLIKSKPLNTSELGKMSLFDLITENVQQVPKNSKAPGVHFGTCKIQQSIVNTIGQQYTDSKMVTKKKSLKTTLTENSIRQSKKPVNLYKAFNGNVSIRNRRPSKRTRTTSWTKRCCAEPSWFALAMCFQNPVKKKKNSLLIHKTFLYSRQVPERMGKDQDPLFEIKPFDFSTPSPDDIVKASQKKIFH